MAFYFQGINTSSAHNELKSNSPKNKNVHRVLESFQDGFICLELQINHFFLVLYESYYILNRISVEFIVLMSLIVSASIVNLKKKVKPSVFANAEHFAVSIILTLFLYIDENIEKKLSN